MRYIVHDVTLTLRETLVVPNSLKRQQSRNPEANIIDYTFHELHLLNMLQSLFTSHEILQMTKYLTSAVWL